MQALPDMQSERKTKATPEKAALKLLEAELSERERMQEELRGLVADLEQQLSHCNARLSDAKAALEAERSRSDREIARLNETLTSEKTARDIVSEELASFSYSISHDLRAPLRHLIGFSTALTEDFGAALEPTAQGYLDCIVRAGNKMEHQVEALLNLSRIARQPMALTGLDLGQLARRCADSLHEADLDRPVAFRIAEQLSVHADQQLMKIAMDHLLSNAWKFTGEKGSATIEFGRKEEGGESVYYVRDDGAGYDPRFAERLFAPFQRMHREEEFPGLGIGLATVQRIIHRHGGRVWAEAGVDEGATFFFTLPE